MNHKTYFFIFQLQGPNVPTKEALQQALVPVDLVSVAHVSIL